MATEVDAASARAPLSLPKRRMADHAPARADQSAPHSARLELSKRDLTLDLARVFCVLLVVAIHLFMTGVGVGPSGDIIATTPKESPLGSQAWFPWATWAGQIMPLFFVVGGFASLTAWRSASRRGENGADYVRNRLLRLAQPALPLYLFYAVVIAVATLAALAPDLVALAVKGAASPLWFLAAYTLCQAMVPTMVRLHSTAPRATLIGLLAGAVIVDGARFVSGVTEVGLTNLFFVWLLIQQIGFWYADGWFARRRAWQLAVIAVVAWATLVPLTFIGPYSFDMLDNLNPPTVPLIALAVGQACVLRLLRPALARLMDTSAARSVVFLAGTRLMTIYLWHLPIILVISGALLLVPGAAPPLGSAIWWWTRPVMYVVVLAVVFALSLLIVRFEAVRPGVSAPAGPVVGLAAVLSFIPSFLVLQFFMSLWIAVLGSVLLSVAILLLTARRAPVA